VIKQHIKELALERSTITPQMRRFLIAMATRCYEIKGIPVPAACGHSYVHGMLSNYGIKVK
jgi:hypothetical protein